MQADSFSWKETKGDDVMAIIADEKWLPSDSIILEKMQMLQ